jgi:hypothetical protein
MPSEKDIVLEVTHLRQMAKQFEILKKEAESSKLFLNMCVHDMRSPTASIKLGLQ